MSTIKVNLSVSGLEKLKKELLLLKNSFPKKCEEYVMALAKEGIEVAQSNVGGFGKYITFSIQTDPTEYGCTALLLAQETGKIISKWKQEDGTTKTADVSPLLMAEFGSGWGAENPLKIPGVGQGTFPDQSHAFDKEGWYWMDENDEWHYSKGITAKMPMYKASKKIQKKIKSKAREVFNK